MITSERLTGLRDELDQLDLTELPGNEAIRHRLEGSRDGKLELIDQLLSEVDCEIPEDICAATYDLVGNIELLRLSILENSTNLKKVTQQVEIEKAHIIIAISKDKELKNEKARDAALLIECSKSESILTREEEIQSISLEIQVQKIELQKLDGLVSLYSKIIAVS